MAEPASPVQLRNELAAAGYLADIGLSTAAFLAGALNKPLLLEGEPGAGKTALALALATVRKARLIRLQCYEGIDAAGALYDWNFPRQMLHLRAAELTGTLTSSESSLYTEDFLIERPILAALRNPPAVLLIDEIDRADDEFEAFLLEVLTDFAVTIPELGRVAATAPPLVILTSNRTRDVHDALKRRCLYHWVSQPDLDLEIRILRMHLPQLSGALARQVALAAGRLRRADLLKPPGVAESLDWARALGALSLPELDATAAGLTLGTVLKYREDAQRITDAGLAQLVRDG